MEKFIWVLDQKKEDLIQMQRQINESGGLKAVCHISDLAIEKNIQRLDLVGGTGPSLMLFDYRTLQNEDFATMHRLKNNPKYAGVPVFFVVDENTDQLQDVFYEKGATVVLKKPLSPHSILRIERMALQFEMTKDYEKIVQKQVSELRTAKEISLLNQKLKSRNELLHRVFGRYFSDEVVEVILEDPQGATIGGEKCLVTVMMADLRGFTALSDSLAPDIVSDLLNHFLEEMTKIITKYQGTIIEFIGDAILAVFGAPITTKEPIRDAISAAIEMQNSMKQVNEYNENQGYPQIEMGIGVHQGEVFIGNIGSEQMMRYNVIGQAVNLASRIENFSVGGQILVSKQTLEQLDCQVHVKSSFEISVKGSRERIPLCEVTGLSGESGCYLREIVEEPMRALTREVKIQIFPVRNKMVEDSGVDTQAQGFSAKRCLVSASCCEQMALYENVMLTAYDEEGQVIFHHVYGKVVEKKDETLMIHFTYVTEEFLSFYKKLRGGM